MRGDESDELALTIAEATAAFDAANHAFGRFVTYVVRPSGRMPAAVQQVRELLQEAAITVPEEPTRQAIGEFAGSLRAAQAGLAAFFADPPEGYALEEALPTPEALDEAIEVLQRALESLP